LNLVSLYFEVKANIDRVRFDELWQGFAPFKFALYDADKCFFNGSFMKKPATFVANTSVLYEGEYIAIWHVMEPMNPTVLATKIIHEMFHAFQNVRGDTRFPNELEALSKYRYDEVNLSLKYEENKILLGLMEDFNLEAYSNFLAYRSSRREKFPYEFGYEASVEEVEGVAQYVELNALKQLSGELYAKSIERLKKRVLVAEDIFPVRVRCYDVGAILFQVLIDNHLLEFKEHTNVLSADRLLADIQESNIETILNPGIIEGLNKYRSSTLEMIQKGINEGVLIEEGELEVLGVNFYNARYAEGNIISTYFVWYRKDGQENLRYGDFLIQLDKQNKGSKIFQINI